MHDREARLVLTGCGAGSDPELSTLRQAAWGHMSDSARNGFLWPGEDAQPLVFREIFCQSSGR